MTIALPLPGVRPIVALARREAVSALRGTGVWLAASIALAVAGWLLLIDLRALDVAGVLVPTDPFRAPLDAAFLVLALYFAIGAAVSTARDRESGTLEVLFFAPMDETSYAAGKVLGIVLAFVALLPVIGAGFVILSLVTGFRLGLAMPLSLILSVVPAAMVAAFGVLVAIGTSRVRTAVLFLGGAAVLFVGVGIAYSIVLLVPIDNPSSPLLVLRDALGYANGLIRWISPFALMQRVVAEGVAVGAWQSAANGVAVAAGATLLMTAASALWLRVRGVQRAGE